MKHLAIAVALLGLTLSGCQKKEAAEPAAEAAAPAAEAAAPAAEQAAEATGAATEEMKTEEKKE